MVFMGGTQRGAELENKMKIASTKIKLFGKVAVLFQVVDNTGEVLQVLETKEEAEAWIASQA